MDVVWRCAQCLDGSSPSGDVESADCEILVFGALCVSISPSFPWKSERGIKGLERAEMAIGAIYQRILHKARSVSLQIVLGLPSLE